MALGTKTAPIHTKFLETGIIYVASSSLLFVLNLIFEHIKSFCANRMTRK